MCRKKWWVAAFLIALTGSQIASANPPVSPSETATLVFAKLPPLWHCFLCLAAGRYKQTIAICNEVLGSSPNNQRAYALRGYAHLFKKNEDQQAITDFTEALRCGPDNAAIHVARARAYGQAKDYDRAIADCTEAIRIDPGYGEAYAWRAETYLKKRVLNKAVADYSLALRHAPFLAWARCGRAEAYRRRGESARALADLEEVLRDDPENEDALVYRCTVYITNLHDFDRVLAESSKGIRRNPREPKWYMLRGQAYLENEEITKALRDWTTAASLKSGPSLHLHWRSKKHSLVLAYEFGTSGSGSGEDDPDERIAACTKRLASDPNNVAAYYERAAAYARKNDFKQALADYNEIIHRDAADAEAYLERGWAYLELKEYTKAIADCTHAIDMDPDYVDNYILSARVYGAQRKWEEALHKSNQALRLDPRISAAHEFRGWIYGERKDYPAALAEYSEAIRLSPEMTDAHLERAWTYAESGKYDEAIADYKKVLQLDPQNQMALWGLGWHLATCPDARLRDGKEAQEHATRLCEASEWKEPAHLSIFAATCAECGDFDQAIRCQTRALELAPEKKKDDYRKRLELYRSHQPYHHTASSASITTTQ